MVSSAGWWSGVEAAAGHLGAVWCGQVRSGVVWCGVVVWRQVGILELVEKREGAPLDAAHTPILRRSWHVSRG